VAGRRERRVDGDGLVGREPRHVEAGAALHLDPLAPGALVVVRDREDQVAELAEPRIGSERVPLRAVEVDRPPSERDGLGRPALRAHDARGAAARPLPDDALLEHDHALGAVLPGEHRRPAADRPAADDHHVRRVTRHVPPRGRRGAAVYREGGSVSPVTLEARERRLLVEEVLVVLSLSLLANAVFAIIDLLTAPIRGITVYAANQNPLFAVQLASFVFGLAPAWLVVYLVQRSGEGVGAIGLDLSQPKRDILLGLALFVVISLGGIAVYLGSVALGVNRFVVPAPPLGHWWTVPVLVLNAVEAGLLEEVIAVYLITRLRQLGLTAAAAVAASALLRGTYHLYQGWGGFLGNLAMGLLFGFVFVRTKRAWPLVIAHTLLDVGAGAGYILFRKHLPGFSWPGFQ
jgi:membrane protease YdiL (CAAX protease family)